MEFIFMLIIFDSFFLPGVQEYSAASCSGAHSTSYLVKRYLLSGKAIPRGASFAITVQRRQYLATW